MSVEAQAVLLHGWAYHAGVWERVEAETSAKTLALDLPGYGKLADSDFPESLDQLAEQMLQRAPKKAIWVGWSLGGLVAMRAAVLAPDRVKALLLVCTTPKFVRSPDWDWGMEINQFEAFAEGLKQEYSQNLGRFLLLQAGDSAQARLLRKPIANIIDSAPKPSLNNLLKGLHILRSTDLRGQVKQLQMPVHLISGEKDRVCHPNASEWIAEQTGGTLNEIYCGHFPPLSDPSEVAQLLSSLVSGAAR